MTQTANGEPDRVEAVRNGWINPSLDVPLELFPMGQFPSSGDNRIFGFEGLTTRFRNRDPGRGQDGIWGCDAAGYSRNSSRTASVRAMPSASFC